MAASECLALSQTQETVYCSYGEGGFPWFDEGPA